MLVSVSVRIISTQAGCMYKEKEKTNALGLALVFMLTSRFHDTCCFTCTYAYVRACVTSENKAFMLVPTPDLRFQRLELGNNQCDRCFV